MSSVISTADEDGGSEKELDIPMLPMSSDVDVSEEIAPGASSSRREGALRSVSRLRRRRKTKATVSRFEKQVGEPLEVPEKPLIPARKAKTARSEQRISSCDFFTRAWEDPLPSGSVPAIRIQDTATGIEEESDALQVLETPLVQIQRPEITILRQPRVVDLPNAFAQGLLFIPKISKQSLTDTDHVEGYDPAADGLYVGKRSTVQGRNERKMRSRLLASGDKKFLDSQGKVETLTDPLSDVSMRPLPEQEDRLSSLLETTFYPPRDQESMLMIQRSRGVDSEQRGVEKTFHMDVDIHTLLFHHHPLFNKEMFLAQKLREVFDSYESAIRNSPTDRLTRRITSLHEAVKRIRGKPDLEERLKMYSHQLQVALTERDVAFKCQRDLLENLQGLWREIKEERERKGFSSSEVRLEIQAIAVEDLETAEGWAKRQIREEYSILKEELDEAYNEAFKAYRQTRREWRRNKDSRDEARERQDKRLENEFIPDDTEELRENDMKVLSAEPLSEPRPPEPVNENELLRMLTKKRKELQGDPGDPQLIPRLHDDWVLTERRDIRKRSEIHRVQAVDKIKIFITVLINRRVAHSTAAANIQQPSFSIVFKERINTIMVTPPFQLLLQIFEKGTLSDTMLAQLEVPLPGNDIVTGETASLESFPFSSDRICPGSAGTVGAGKNILVREDWNETPVLNGSVSVSVSWKRNAEHVVLAPTREPTFLHNHLKQLDDLPSSITQNTIREWTEASQLDPLDPKNSKLFSVLKSFSTGETSIISNCFRLTQEFFVDEPLDNPRFRVLRLRDAGVPKFRGLRMVPNNLHSWSKDPAAEALRTFDKKRKESERDRQPFAGAKLKEHEARLRTLKKRLQDWIHNRLEFAQSKKTLSDVVIEESVPDISVMGKKLLHFFSPYRPLRPERIERKKVNIRDVIHQEIKLVVTVLKATNVPIRIEKETSSSMVKKNEEEDTFVAPFVEVMFDRRAARTVTSQGSIPSWNQQITLPFLSSWDSFEDKNDTIYLNLFDEISLDVLEDNRERANTIHKRLVRQWLGSLKIPVTTLLCNPKVEGTFRIDTPPVILGYEWEGKEWLPTLISLFMTTDPPVMIPEATVTEKLPTLEPISLTTAAFRWQKSLRERFPKRKVDCLVMDVNCHAVFVTRYVTPLAPPLELEGNDMAMARFVSLIPYIPDANLGQTNCDIWTNCEQFLSMLGGDEEEHALLLLNFFLHLGKAAWLLIGEDRGGKEAAFVCTLENGEHFIWHPTSGDKFCTTDPFLPVSQIWCAVNESNVWANIHKDAPDRTSLPAFDFNNSTHWEPFFGKAHPAMPILATVQPPYLTSTPPDPVLADELQKTIETTLKENFMNWRKRHRTTWNRHCTSLLRGLLPAMERSPNLAKSDEHMNHLREILLGFKVIGFPLNSSYETIDDLLESVHATNLHSHEGKDVEFSIAVYVHPYPCGVLSVWIYAACLRLRE